MACIVTINVKGHSFKYETSLNPEDITLENIAKEIADTNAGTVIDFSDKGVEKQGQSLGKALAAALSSAESLTERTTGIKQIIRKALDGKGGQLVGNYMLSDMGTRFPGIDFQGLELGENESILVTKNIQYGGLGLGGKITIGTSSVYVVSGRRDAAKLAKYLRTRQQLQNESLDLDLELSEREKKAIDYIKEKAGIKSTQKALLHFFNKSDQYLTSVTDGDIDVYTTLSDVIKEKVTKDYVRQRLENPIANSIMKRAFYADGKHIISNEEFLKIMDMFGIEEDFSKPGFLKSWLQSFMSDSGNPVNVDVSPNGNIFITLPYNTMRDLDFTYEDIVLMQEEPLASVGPFKVFNYKGSKYFVSQDKMITLDSRAQSFDSVSEAHAYAKQRFLNTTIARGFNRARFGVKPKTSRSVSSFIDLNKDGTQTVETKEAFNPALNTVFEVLDYELDSTKSLKELINKDLIKYLNTPIEAEGTKDSLYKLLRDTYKISKSEYEKIDSYDKALALLVEMSKLPELNTKTVSVAIKTVSEIPTYEFMVIAKHKYQDVNKLVVQRVSDVETAEDTYVPPALPLLQKLAEAINDKFTRRSKITEPLVYVITNSDITNGEYGLNEFQNVDRSASGFIFNGHIYINASYAHLDDLAHEFGHLFLGVMKAANFEEYMKLMETVSSMLPIKRLKEKKRMQPQYANLADEDLTEEAFVDLFGDYLKGNNKTLGVLAEDIGTIEAKEAADKRRVEDAKAKGKLAEAKNFLMAALEDLGTSFEGAVTLQDIFNNFNIAMKSLLYQGNGLEFEDTAKYRRVSNFISSEIGKGEGSLIQMNC